MERLNNVKGRTIFVSMVHLIHPAKDDITLEGVLAALADPVRLLIVKALLEQENQSCCRAASCTEIAKSTLSHHFRVLREAGIIRTTKKGVENLNTVRSADLNARFPGLLKTVIKAASQAKSHEGGE
jgi:DNA-binding transcriptional ArsR family regulator